MYNKLIILTVCLLALSLTAACGTKYKRLGRGSEDPKMEAQVGKLTLKQAKEWYGKPAWLNERRESIEGQWRVEGVVELSPSDCTEAKTCARCWVTWKSFSLWFHPTTQRLMSYSPAWTGSGAQDLGEVPIAADSIAECRRQGACWDEAVSLCRDRAEKERGVVNVPGKLNPSAVR